MHTIISQRNSIMIEDKITVAVDNDATAGVSLKGFPILGLLCPAMTTATITVQISIDGGSSWFNLVKSDGTTPAISISGTATDYFITSDDLTPLAAYCGTFPDAEFDILIRLKSSAVQAGNRTFTWICVA